MSDSTPSSGDSGSTGSSGGDSGWGQSGSGDTGVGPGSGGSPSGGSDPGQQSGWEGQQESWRGQQEPPPPTHQEYGGGGSHNPYTSPYTQPYGQQDPQQPYGQPYGQSYGQQPYGAGQPWPYTGPARANDGGATTSMVIGIVALAVGFMCGIGFLASPVALFMGLSARKRIDRSGGRLDGRGQATAGFWLGVAGTVLLLLAIAAVVLFIVAGVNGFFDTTTTYDYDGVNALVQR